MKKYSELFQLSGNKDQLSAVYGAYQRWKFGVRPGSASMFDRRRRFEAEVLLHLDAAYNLARWLARPPLDADDIVQDAVLRAYQAFDSVRGENVKPWLLTIVRNCFLTAVSQLKHKQSIQLPDDSEISLVDHALIDGDQSPEATMIQEDVARQLDGVLARLPPEFREILVLREMESMPYNEIAQVLGVPIGTVMSRLARARGLLKKHWFETAGEGRHVMQ
jgi:RNA polymerase sigma factor (sigma-70 family)